VRAARALLGDAAAISLKLVPNLGISRRALIRENFYDNLRVCYIFCREPYREPLPRAPRGNGGGGGKGHECRRAWSKLADPRRPRKSFNGIGYERVAEAPDLENLRTNAPQNVALMLVHISNENEDIRILMAEITKCFPETKVVFLSSKLDV